MSVLNDRIKKARAATNLTLEDVAAKVGVSRQTIQKYESGVISNIPSDRIEKIAEALGTTPSKLMGWEEEQEYIDGAEEARLVKKYSRLSKANRQAVLNLIDNLLEAQSSL